MKTYLLLASLVALAIVQVPTVAQEEPLRIFIRSGPKSHGPGAHEHPRFLEEWVPMLNARGARATGAQAFPTREQLAETDVLILHAQEAGNIDPPDRQNLTEFLVRGGGMVVIHAAAVSRDPDWYRQIVGGSWRHGTTRWLEGPMHLYFTDRGSPITRDISNWEMDDEIYYDMDMQPDVQVLAAAYTPKPAGARNPVFERRALELTGGGKRVSIFDVQPQIWTYERTIEGGRTPYRAMVSLPGHLYVNFDRPAYRALLLRGIAWAGKRANVNLLLGEDDLGDTLRYVENGPVHPAKAAETIEIHPEFDLTLVAAEPLIAKAMSVDWDGRGRLWVAETPEYPNGRRAPNVEPWKETGSLHPTRTDRDPEDTISILTDTNGDGVMDHRHVFADKLELVTSFVLHRNGVIAAAAPDIWYLEDTTGDEMADRRTKLYTGLGTFDTHAVINNLRWGLDGWIYATHGYSTGTVTSPDGSKTFGRAGSGVVRFKPDGSAFEQYSSRGGNTWGLDITWDGQVFWTQPTSGTVLFHTLLPEYVLAKGRLPGTTSWKGMITGQNSYPLMTWPEQAYVQIDQVGQFTAAAGCVIYDGGAWPDRWRHSYFTTEPTLNLVHHQFVVPAGVSYTTRKEPGREQTEFMRSRDMWFRPIETRVGPDGALYIVDFYNQAVIHNDTRGPHHGPANAAVRPDRDHYFGRIWRVQHKEARQLDLPALDRRDLPGLIRAMETSPNAHVRLTAWRLAQESHAGDARLAQISRPMGSKALEVYERARGATTSADRHAMLDLFVAASDDWTKSAIVAAAADAPAEYLDEAFAHARAAALADFVAAVVPAALPSHAGRLLALSSAASPRATTLRPIVVVAVARMDGGALVLDTPTTKALESLLGDSATDAAAAAIVARWDTGGELSARANSRAATLVEELNRPGTPNARRVEIAESLLAVPSQRAAVLSAIESMLAAATTPDPLKARLMTTLGSTSGSDVDRAMVGALARTQSPLVFDHILKRPAAARALVAAMEQGLITPKALGPGNVARLRTHPNRDVAREASALLDKLLPQARKADVVASVLPHVLKAGDPERGRNLFVGACGACHRIGDVGTGTIGPPLNGMGAHGRAELLTHIIDPNREVDPSFWQWNITTKGGQALAGVIVSESSAGLTLRTEGGDVVLKKEEIASRENTRRSLMPEGLEALGSDVLRDILAFMEEGDARFRIVDLRQAYTADSRRGLRREEERDETVTLHRFGDVTVSGVPFFVMDPARSTTGLNFIALRTGPSRGNALDDLPARVEIPTSVTAASLHVLGGVGGWAWPHGGDAARGKPVMRIMVHFADGSTEEHVLRNGEHVADFDGHVDVPLSTRAGDFTRRGQLRYFAINLTKTGALSKLVLESLDSTVVPATVAITASMEPAELSQRGASATESATAPQRGASAPESPTALQRGASAPESPTAPQRGASAPRSPSTGQASRAQDETLQGIGASATPGPGTTARVDVPGLQPSAGDAVQDASGPREGGKGDAPLPETRPIVWEPGKTKVALIAGGSAHDFGRHFGETDGATLRAAGFSVHYTEDRDQAVEALAQADVAVVSVNRQHFDTPAYRKALFDFAARGKGLVMLHPGTWYAFPGWPELNAQIVGGGARGHDRIAAFSVNAVRPDHPVMRGVPASFEVEDELYYVNPDPQKLPPGTAPIEVLAETSPSVKFKTPHPSVWVTTHPSARIANIALGHDERVHEHPAFRTLLVNAVRWVGRMD